MPIGPFEYTDYMEEDFWHNFLCPAVLEGFLILNYTWRGALKWREVKNKMLKSNCKELRSIKNRSETEQRWDKYLLISKTKQMNKLKMEVRQIRTWSKPVDWATILPPRFHRRPKAPSLRAPEKGLPFWYENSLEFDNLVLDRNTNKIGWHWESLPTSSWPARKETELWSIVTQGFPRTPGISCTFLSSVQRAFMDTCNCQIFLQQWHNSVQKAPPQCFKKFTSRSLPISLSMRLSFQFFYFFWPAPLARISLNPNSRPPNNALTPCKGPINRLWFLIKFFFGLLWKALLPHTSTSKRSK